MPDQTNEDAARAEERWFRGIDDAPTPPSDAGTSERETETHKGRDLEWSRYPLGTKAREVGDDGAYWLRVEGGWTWCTGNIRATPAAELDYEVTRG